MSTVSYETCPTSAPFFGFMGVTAALCFASEETYVVVMILIETSKQWMYAMLYITYYSLVIIVYIYIPTLFYFYYLDIGAAYGTAKSGVGIASMGVMHPGLVMKNIIPVVMAGVLGIYGLIVAVIIQGSSKYKYSVMDSK